MTDWARLRADVAREATTIAVGSTASVECPKCTGGNTGERSMSLTRAANGSMFLCHRASCGFRGFVGMDGAGMSRDTPRKKEARPYRGHSDYLQPWEMGEFLDKYKGFPANFPTADTMNWGLRKSGDELVFECRGFDHELLGHVTRTPDKVIRTWRATDNHDLCSVYLPPWEVEDRKTLVIVEDCISAMCCASHGYTGIALLGTHLTPEVREAIKAHGFRTVVVRLDPDANSKALAIANENGWQAWFSECDPKDDPELGTMEARL